MTTLRILDSLSLPGSPDRANEDSFGATANCAFVIDGATGLGENFINGPENSDAAWLANFARARFEEDGNANAPVGEIVRAINTAVRAVVDKAAGSLPVEDWRLPIAGFQMVRAEGGQLRTYGLGDCVLFIVDADGHHQRITALGDGLREEQATAREALHRIGGFENGKPLINDEALRDGERRVRASFNKPGAPVWTLGCAADAGDHVQSTSLAMKSPMRGVLCTDGFAALADVYHRYDTVTLVQAACEKGLGALADQLRHIEQVEDPSGRIHARMKRSDDATAIVFEFG